jgi:hypothetical protein
VTEDGFRHLVTPSPCHLVIERGRKDMPEVEIPDPDEVHEKAEKPFTKQVALCVAVYAVGLAVASFGGHNAAKEMMFAKQEEANQWNRFQSKSTREALYRNEIKKLEIDKKIAGSSWPPEKDDLLKWYRDEAQRMKQDKDDIENGGADNGGMGAKYYQGVVRLMQRKDPYFDFAEVGFQLAIVLSSVAMLSQRRWAFLASAMLAVLAVLLTINGFGLFLAVPGFEDIGY